MFNGQSNSDPRTGVVTQPLPPLPDLKTSSSGSQAAPDDPFKATMMAIKPVHDAVTTINAAVAAIAKTGMIPGGGPLDQIIQLTNSLLPIAAQQMLKPGGMNGMLPPPSSAPGDLGNNAGPVAPGPPPSGPPGAPTPPAGM